MSPEQVRIIKQLDVEAAKKRAPTWAVPQGGISPQGQYHGPEMLALVGLHKARTSKAMRKHITQDELEQSREFLARHGYQERP